MRPSPIQSHLAIRAGVALAVFCLAACHLSDPIRDNYQTDVDDSGGAAADTHRRGDTPRGEIVDGDTEPRRDSASDTTDTTKSRDSSAPDAADSESVDSAGPVGDANDVDSAEDSGSERPDVDAGPSCNDGIENGDETAVDCGGLVCEGCTVGEQCNQDSDCTSGWCRGGACHVRIEGDLDLLRAGRWSDGSVASSCDGYRHPTEPNYHYTSTSGTPGDGIYVIEPDPAGGPFLAYCEMDRAGGGWTLAVVSADDSQRTWTWDQRTLFSTDTSTFGSPAKRRNDYKGRAFHEISIGDLLFVHQPTDEWLSYNGVGSGSKSIATLIADRGETCYADSSSSDNVKPGIPKSGGTVAATADLCSTDLYLNPKDQDGSGACGDDDHAFGPAWSANEDGAGCPFDDPGEASSLGPNFEKKSTEQDARGFAKPLGKTSSGDAILMYVR